MNERTFTGFATIAFGSLACLHFVRKFRRRKRVTSAALAAVCFCLVLGTLPLHERVPSRFLWIFRVLYAAAVAFLWWSIRRVDHIEQAFEDRQASVREMERWRRENAAFLQGQQQARVGERR